MGDYTIKEILVSRWHTCVIRHTEDIVCFGWNSDDDGLLGTGNDRRVGRYGEDMGNNLVPVKLGRNTTVKTGDAGYDAICVITNHDRVKCWGNNEKATLGIGNTLSPMGIDPDELGDRLNEVDLGVNRTAKRVSVGDQTACVITKEDNVVCWGSNEYGLCGVGVGESSNSRIGDDYAELGDALKEVDLGTDKKAKDICVAPKHICVLLNTDEVVCWGRNLHGVLGRGDEVTTIGESPATMGDNLVAVNLGSGRTPKSLACNDASTCALLTSGDVVCWGRNNYGRLGIVSDAENIGVSSDQMGDNLTAIDFGMGRKVDSIAGNDDHYCAILEGSEAQVLCWGKIVMVRSVLVPRNITVTRLLKLETIGKFSRLDRVGYISKMVIM